MDRKHLTTLQTVALLALNNVMLVDNVFGNTVNTVDDFLKDLELFESIPPQIYVQGVARIPTPLQVNVLQNGVALTDLIYLIRFNDPTNDFIFPDIMKFAGASIVQRFKSDDTAPEYQMQIIPYLSYDPLGIIPPIIAADFYRELTVKPTSGGNSTSEYSFFSVKPPSLLDYNAVSAEYNSMDKKKQTYFNLWDMLASPVIPNVNQRINMVALIFKGISSINQTITINPLFAQKGMTSIIEGMWLGAGENPVK